MTEFAAGFSLSPYTWKLRHKLLLTVISFHRMFFSAGLKPNTMAEFSTCITNEFSKSEATDFKTLR